ncbi:MAG: hypothetical protein CO164_00925 [Rhodocyclales bacterium CG_4_9_14_3_um_filter_68_10]|nr:MAG: hypothetical protein CO164_00925 [Rhodocyclales bacterium CG_4_9_14_3_um_filter_68_10]
MARPLRIEFPGAVYHLTARGDRQGEIFADDEDRREFLDLFGREVEQQRWVCYAWCLMPNHYHLVVETPEPNLVTGMRRLNGAYTQRFNRRHERVGHVFQGRYKAIVVDRDSYLLELCRYVALNPVRAAMVADPQAYPWSSYRATVGQMRSPEWFRREAVLGLFSGARPGAAYAHFVAAGVGRAAPWDALRGQIYLGDAAFLDRMQKMIGGAEAANVPRAHLRPARPAAREVLAAVARGYGVAVSGVTDRSHRAAFRAAVYLLRRVCNEPLAATARAMGVSAARVSQIQHETDAMKPDPVLAALLENYKLRN